MSVKLDFIDHILIVFYVFCLLHHKEAPIVPDLLKDTVTASLDATTAINRAISRVASPAVLLLSTR